MSAVTTLTDRQRELVHKYGSTDASAVMGENPWQRPIDVYRQKIAGEFDEVSDSHHIERGVFLEDGLLRWAAKRIGMTVARGETFTSDAYPLLRSTPDGLIELDDGTRVGCLEVKFPGPNTLREWDLSVDDETGVPARYTIQCTQHMMCTGLRRCWLVAFISGDIHVWEISWSPELAEAINATVTRFHHEHVIPGAPPPIDGSSSYDKWLTQNYPQSSGREIAPTDEIGALLLEMGKAKDAAKKHEERAAMCAQKIKAAMGDAERCYVPGVGRVSWKEQAGRIAYAKAVKALGATDEQLEAFRGKPTRVFRTTWEDKE